MDFKETVLGIELGSTRIKAVLLDRKHTPIAFGGYEWENKLIDGYWTYSMDEVHDGLRACFADLKRDVKEKFAQPLTTVGAIGISGMMHGYLPLDENGNILTAFRTWRNSTTAKAAAELTEKFDFNIPQRWSIAHLYQAILNGEEHLPRIKYLTTLCGYVHWKLTGERVLGVGEAAGMFPIDSKTNDYDSTMLDCFEKMIADKAYPWKIREILPKSLVAGDAAGTLTEAGALFLDPTGELCPGIPMVPPEGDMGTGMVATNSVKSGTGNISAGTSVNAMVVTEQKLKMHTEIDMVATPAGTPVAMVHCSNCTSDINAWVNLFGEFADVIGASVSKGELYTILFKKALEGSLDCGGLLSYNYYSGEGITRLNEGRPIFARMPDSDFSLANFMRTHLVSALATLKIGMDILTAEDVCIETINAHGGYFKTPGVGQRILSAAFNCPVSVMETAGEGGPYGMALLASYYLWNTDGKSLDEYLETEVFASAKSVTLMAQPEEIEGFARYLELYKKALPVEISAVETMK
ncbi:MAG: ATPase [Clostridia bacterium]|nr:ATPase [Clostridia bacterium]